MILELREEHLQHLRESAERTYPNECCGLLLGRSTDREKILVEVWETENTWNNESAQIFEFDSISATAVSQERRYTIAPEAMLAAQRYARASQLEIIGIYHSHPDHPAIPSECDRRWAWQHYSYIIASVKNGKTVDVQSWQLDNDQQFQPEEMRLNG